MQYAIVSKRDFEDEDEETKELKYPRISYRQLIEATKSFSASSLISLGQFRQVYKGVLSNNTRIAVKVLDTTTVGEFSYFGIARLVKSDDSMPTSDSSCNSTHGLLCGSLGHIALGVYQILFCYKDLQINTY